MTPATVFSATAAAAADGNHYYANISQQHDQCKKKYMFKHGHRCYASSTFDRLQFRTEARLPKVAAAAVEVRSVQHCKASAGAAAAARHSLCAVVVP